MNMRNFGIAEGRLTRDITVFENSDGSHKVMLTIAAQDNFKGRDGSRKSQYISLEAFVPAGPGLGVYEHLSKGDMVGVEYTVKSNSYKDKDGKDVYSTVLAIQNIDLKETKGSKNARLERAAKAGQPEQAPAADEDAPFAE